MESMTQDQWNAIVEALGSEEAEAWKQRNGVQVEGEELPPLEPNFKLGVPQAGALKTEAPQAPAGALGMPVKDQLTGLYGDLIASQERARTARIQLLQNATAALETRQFGPSTADKLYAISAALLSPTRHRGFAGMMSNLVPAMQQISSATRQGAQAKTDALQQLRERYMEAGLEDEQSTIKSRIDLIKAARSTNGMQVASDPMGNRFNTKTGFDVPGPAHIKALLANPQYAREFDLKFGPGAAARVFADYGGQ